MSPVAPDPPAREVCEPAVDWAALYDRHPEYTARRGGDSYSRGLIDLEVRLFKLPNLLEVLGEPPAASLLEIGCATGELTAAFPVASGGRRVGVDISLQNIEAARRRFPDCEFLAGDFRTRDLGGFDVVLLSDVLEHVPDDEAFLSAAAALGRRVLINLPLECNWLNRRRTYGPDDVSGHLRAYRLDEGLALIARAGLRVERCKRVWVHEGAAEHARRQLRAEHFGRQYAGGALGSGLRRVVFGAAAACRPLGRRLFASNLFALASPLD